MNIYSAVRSLRNGQAIRPAGWLGYAERIDKAPDAAYVDTAEYAVGSHVTRNGTRYACVAATGPGPFDPDKWTRVENDRYVVFVDRKDDTEEDPDDTDNPSAVYLATVGTSSESVTWERKSGAIPDEIKAVHPSWAGRTIPTPVDMPDDKLFAALVGDTWESGSASDFEIQRSGGGGRW